MPDVFPINNIKTLVSEAKDAGSPALVIIDGDWYKDSDGEGGIKARAQIDSDLAKVIAKLPASAEVITNLSKSKRSEGTVYFEVRFKGHPGREAGIDPELRDLLERVSQQLTVLTVAAGHIGSEGGGGDDDDNEEDTA